MFNLGSSFLIKIYQAVTTDATEVKDSKASNNSSVINAEKQKVKVAKIGKDQRCEVRLKALGGLMGMFSESQPVVIYQKSPECIQIAAIKKLSLESHHTSESGYGTFWDVTNLKVFSITGKSSTVRQFIIDDKRFECRFQTEEECNVWTKYFENWNYRMKSHVSTTPSGTQQH
ncbi:hypothetical protein BC833DRAFT_214835 [Globomyces pollinis-pini]|nr:hypothetical protein BC833DRAFT_214835 [Globomyces pollinis-pini]